MLPSIQRLDPRDFDPGVPSEEFRNQWRHPAGVFAVLLILGGDVVRRALAQLAGSRFTPVAFSFGSYHPSYILEINGDESCHHVDITSIETFADVAFQPTGWVSYAVAAVVSALGDNKLMPPPDCGCRVINGQNGYVRDNSSWIIGRMMRDYDRWMDARIKTKLDTIITEAQTYNKEEAMIKKDTANVSVPKPPKAGLCVSIYTAELAKPGCPGYTRRYFMGVGTIVVQLGMCAIPCGLSGDWSFFLITVCGNLLALATGMLSQWKKEKWACRTKSNKKVILTRGNGSQHAIVIISDGKGLDLEDLATGSSDVFVSASWLTQVGLCTLGVLWILLLITAAGIVRRTEYLLFIGALGILQNMFVAGLPRNPKDYGIPIKFNTVIGSPKVMKTLFDVEQKYPRVGRSMRDTFFPGILHENETDRWKLLEDLADAKDKATKDEKARTEADEVVKKAKNDMNKAQQDANGAIAAILGATNRHEQAEEVVVQATMTANRFRAEVTTIEESLMKLPDGDELAKTNIAADVRWQAAKAKATQAEADRVSAAARAEAAGVELERAQQAVRDRNSILQTKTDYITRVRSDARNKKNKADASREAADAAQQSVNEATAAATGKEEEMARERKRVVDAIVQKAVDAVAVV